MKKRKTEKTSLSLQLLGVMLVGFLELISFNAQHVHASINVEKYKNFLEQTGATWSAKQTWVSKLSPEQRKALLTENSDISTNLNYNDVYNTSVTYDGIDWRNQNGVNWVGEPLTQGLCGSCMAFATIETLESQVAIASQAPWLKPRFSPQALFVCGGGVCKKGWTGEEATSYVVQKGVVDNACAPYTMGADGKDVQCQQFCPNQNDRTYKVKGTYQPTDGRRKVSAAAVKLALKKGPLIAGMIVHEDFFIYSGGIYKTTTDKIAGGHAVSLVGYSDSGRYWIIRNSWGSDWGENGFMRVSWDDLSGLGSLTFGFDVGTENKINLAVTIPRENEYSYGKINLQAQVSKTDSQNLSYNIMNQGNVIQSISAGNAGNAGNAGSSAMFKGSFDTSKLKDGKYEVVAINGKQKSLVRGFYVSNTMPQMDLKIAAKQVTMRTSQWTEAQNLIVLNIGIKSTTLMPQSVELVIQSVATKKQIVEQLKDVAGKMSLAMNRDGVPAGDYVFFLKAHLPVGGVVKDFESPKATLTVGNNNISKNNFAVVDHQQVTSNIKGNLEVAIVPAPYFANN